MRMPLPLAAIFLTAQIAAAAEGQPFNQTVLLLPLKSIGETSNTAWIAEGIQQNFANELSRFTLASATVVKDQTAVATADEARKAAKAAGAAYGLFGSFQLTDTEIRATAQLLNLKTDAVVGGIRATGPIRDLFSIEDSLAEQLKRLLKGDIQPQNPAPAPVPAPAPQPPQDR